jgi:hypothetical protein
MGVCNIGHYHKGETFIGNMIGLLYFRGNRKRWEKDRESVRM